MYKRGFLVHRNDPQGNEDGTEIADKAILVTGCGTDAAPYFRIFNSVAQEQKFDPNENYVRRIEPEIAALPDEYLFNPWEAPEQVLKEACVELDAAYPKPIVDLKMVTF